MFCSQSQVYFARNTVCPLNPLSFMVIRHIITAPVFNLQLVTFLKLFTFSLSNCYMTYNHVKFLRQKVYIPQILPGTLPKSR